MGTFIFLSAAVVEIGLVVFCIITKSNQRELRSFMRIGAFAAFVLLAILQVIEWSSRYYAIAALLFLLGLMGAAALIRRNDEKRGYKTGRVVLKAVGMIVLIFLFTLPAIIFPQHRNIGVTGKYQVAATKYTFIDTNRIETYTNKGENRKLNVEMWYPKDAEGTYPLIVFSHGSLGIKTSNESLYNELASHGYVVCSIDHTYQCFFTTDEKGHTALLNMGFFNELMAELTKDDRQFSYECYQKWMKIRMGDINFVIDNILKQVKSNDSDKVYKLVDPTKIGVMGHSLGGSAALGIGRMRNDIGAVIALESPFMQDIKGVKDGEFICADEVYPVPVLNVYSDDSWSHLGEWPQYVENHKLLSNTIANAFNVYISGVGHLTLTDLALESPFLASTLSTQKSMGKAVYCLKTINKVSLEFFDCYLKGEGRFTSAGTY
jgi:Predicted dienelactone hydrolase